MGIKGALKNVKVKFKERPDTNGNRGSGALEARPYTANHAIPEIKRPKKQSLSKVQQRGKKKNLCKCNSREKARFYPKQAQKLAASAMCFWI